MSKAKVLNFKNFKTTEDKKTGLYLVPKVEIEIEQKPKCCELRCADIDTHRTIFGKAGESDR